eukprot:Nk52_evm44s152 gene=Nk52_evmTU44s152
MSSTKGAVAAAKSALRKEISSKLKAMTGDSVSKASEKVIGKLLKSELYMQSKHVALYLSMEKEVCTVELLKDIFAKGKTCYIPHYDATDMVMLRINSWEEYESLPETKWKIKQPSDRSQYVDAFETGKLDLVVTPGLGFGKDGSRLGRGRGYYDRFFNACEDILVQGKGETFPVLVGLSLDCQLYDSVPMEPHDKILDAIFSESEECIRR